MGREMKALECGAKVLAVIAVLTAPVAASLTAIQDADASGTRLLSYRQLENTGTGGTGQEDIGITDHSRNPSISADGNLVVFESKASYFDTLEIDEAAADLDSDIFLHNIATGKSKRVSKGWSLWNPVEANGPSYKPSISPNGEWVAFETEATNLNLTGSGLANRNIVRYKISNGVATQASYLTSQFSILPPGNSYNASVADDGTVAFESASKILVQGVTDNNSQRDVFVRKVGGTTELVSVANGASETADNASTAPSISGNGKYVAFQSKASNLMPEVEAGAADEDVFVGNIDDASMKLVSAKPDGKPASSPSTAPSISQEGSRIAFQSKANDLGSPQFTGDKERILVRDLTDPQEKVVNVFEEWWVLVPEGPAISPDGKHVAFTADYNDVDYPPIPTKSWVFIRDVAKSKAAQTVNLTAKGQQATATNFHPSLADKTATGQRAVFESDSPELQENYLVEGMFGMMELLQAKFVNGPLCSGQTEECFQVIVRDMDPDAHEPGPFNPDDSTADAPLVEIETTDTAAGKPTDITMILSRPFDYHEIEDAEIYMPVGLGTSLNMHSCTVAEANTDSCPENSKVGSVKTSVSLMNNLQDSLIPQEGVEGGVYFGEPLPGEAARLFAIIYDAALMNHPVRVDLRITLVEDEYYRLKVSSLDIPNSIEDAELLGQPLGDVYSNITKMSFSIEGSTPDKNGNPFIYNPTFDKATPDLPPQLKGMKADIANYGGSKNHRDVDYQVTDADGLQFGPQIKAKLSKHGSNGAEAKPNQVVDVETTLTRDMSEADIRDTKITFPKGLQVNSLADVEFCKQADAEAWKCGKQGGSGTAIAAIEANSPAVAEPLKGEGFLIEGPVEKPLKLGVFLGEKTDGVKFKMFGEMKLDSQSRVVASFNDLPPYSITQFKMSVDGLMTTNGVGCGGLPKDLSIVAESTSWNINIGKASDTTSVTVGGDASACFAKAFNTTPTFTASAQNHGTGANPGELRLTVKKDPADDPIDTIEIVLPHGMEAGTGATANKCTLSQAKGGGCPSSSQVGTSSTKAQVLGKINTITVKGGIFMAEPQGSEPARLFVVYVLPEIASNQRVVIQSPFSVEDNANRIKAEVAINLPQFNVTEIDMTIWGTSASGGQVVKNPSFASQAHAFKGTFSSLLGAKAVASATYPVDGVLDFKPGFNSGLAKSVIGWSPVVTTDINQDLGHTAIKSIKIGLSGLDLNMAALVGPSATCSVAQWAVRACPESSRVASLTADSWMVPGKPLTGALYLGEGAKKAYLMLRGPASIDMEGDIEIDATKGEISVAIEGMPPLHADIHAMIDSSIFKIPASCKPLKLSYSATSYTGQNHSETEMLNYCKAASSAASLKVKLKPKKVNSYTEASFTLTQAEKKGAKGLKSLEIGLGKGRKALRASTKTLKLATKRSRKVKTIGTLSLASAKKGRSVKANVRVKRGRIYLSPSSKGHVMSKRTLKRHKKIQKQIKKKTKIRILKGKLKLTGLPTTDAYYRVSLTLNGKRFHTLRNPKRPGRITFDARAATNSGSTIRASYEVKLKKASDGKQGKR